VTALGGQVPCFSTLNTYLTPPPIPTALLTAVNHAAAAAAASSSQPTISAIENIVYAMHYPANPSPSGLSTGAQAGIGAGVGVVGLALIALGIFFLLRRRRGRETQKSDPHYSGSTFQSSGPESPPPMHQQPTIPYIVAQHQGLEHHPYANNIPPVPLHSHIPRENPAVPLGGYLPQEDPMYAPRPAYQSWPPIQDQHWQTAQGLQVSPPTSTTASPPPDSRSGNGYSSAGSYTGLRPGQASELHAGQQASELQGGQQERWELGGRS
jgi:hypothetical protein